MWRIIRVVNANANDSHVDYHIYFGVDESEIRGSYAKSGVLTDGGVRIIPVTYLGAEMIKSIQLMAVLCLLCPSMTMAGTIIEIQNKNELTTVLTDGQQARISMGEGEFVIVDHKSQQLIIVDSQEQKVRLFDAKQIPANSYGPTIRTEVKLLGTGSDIAGYKTHKYEYFANGKFCGVIHGSKTAYQVQGVKQLVNAMKVLMDRQQAILGGLAGMLDVCTLADMKLSDQVATIGVPMRSEKNGAVETEIKTIKTGVDIASDAFVIPASYRTTAMQGQINDVAATRAPAQQRQPQMQDTMWQMQPSGQAPPQAMPHMRRAQEMMRQYPY